MAVKTAGPAPVETLFGPVIPDAPRYDGATEQTVRDLIALGVPEAKARGYPARQAHAALKSMRTKINREKALHREPDARPEAERPYKRLVPEVADALDELRKDRADPARLSPQGLWVACMMLEAKDLPDLAQWIEDRLNATHSRIAPRIESGGMDDQDYGGESEAVEIDPRDAEYLRSLNGEGEEIPP